MIGASTVFATAMLALAAGEMTAPAVPPGQPATVAEARMLIERTKQEIAQEEKAWTEDAAREKEAEARRKQRFSEFTQDRLRLQQVLTDQEVKLKEALAKIEGHQMRDRELQARFRKLGEVISSRAKAFRPVLAAGVPYRLDKRLESIDLLVRDLEGGNISPEEGINRLWAFWQSERRLAQEAEVYSGDFQDTAAGSTDPIQVKYLRVGKQIMAFSSLDGSKLGILRRGPDSGKVRYEWVRETDLDRDSRQAVKSAIATAEGKAIPGFVPVPFWRTAFAEPEGAGPGDPAAAPARPGPAPTRAPPAPKAKSTSETPKEGT